MLQAVPMLLMECMVSFKCGCGDSYFIFFLSGKQVHLVGVQVVYSCGADASYGVHGLIQVWVWGLLFNLLLEW